MRLFKAKISVDGEQIKQVLLNLAINSLQAMPDGGLSIAHKITSQHNRSLTIAANK